MNNLERIYEAHADTEDTPEIEQKGNQIMKLVKKYVPQEVLLNIEDMVVDFGIMQDKQGFLRGYQCKAGL